MSGTFKCGMCELTYDKADRAVRLTDSDKVVCVECIDFLYLETD